MEFVRCQVQTGSSVRCHGTPRWQITGDIVPWGLGVAFPHYVAGTKSPVKQCLSAGVPDMQITCAPAMAMHACMHSHNLIWYSLVLVLRLVHYIYYDCVAITRIIIMWTLNWRRMITSAAATWTPGPSEAGRQGRLEPPHFLCLTSDLWPPKSYIKYAKPQQVHAEPAGTDSALLSILDMSSSHSPAIMRDHKWAINSALRSQMERFCGRGLTVFGRGFKFCARASRALNCYKLFYREPPHSWTPSYGPGLNVYPF